MYKKHSVFAVVLVLFALAVSLAYAQLPQIPSGLGYLALSQNPDGTWDSATIAVDGATATGTVLDTLQLLNQTSATSYTTAIAWLQAQIPSAVALMAQRSKLLGLSETTALVAVADSVKHTWGGDTGYETNRLDTSLALQALKSANYTDQSVIFPAITYLLSSQNPDGGWGFTQNDDSNVYMTAQVLSALAQYKTTYLMQQQITNAATFLVSRQNPDGGFGVGSSSVYETALTFIALIESGLTQGAPLQNAITYLMTTQLPNGSWNDDPYSTALALRSLSYVKPDLSILPANIAVQPATPTVGNNTTITATVSNIGLDTATNVTVRLADNGAIIGDQTIASVAPGSTGQATFAISPLTPAGEHILTIAVDPSNTIDEISRTNNTATTRIWANALADLVVLPEYLSISPAYPKPAENITLTFQIANMGESAAANVSADLYDGNPSNGGVKLGSAIVSSINAGGLGGGTITFTLATAGNHTLYLVADPLHAVTETSVTNNSAQKVVTVNAAGGTGFIDLTIPMNGLGITPQRPKNGDTVSVSILTENLGTEAASADVELFDGNPATGGVLLNKTTVTLNAGESRTLTLPWQIPPGVRTLYAHIDRLNAVSERDKNNNSQQLAVMADMVDIEVSASDISITPEHPMDGDPATVKVSIQNRGIAATGAFNVNLYNGDPASGGTLLQTFAISGLAGDAAQEISYPFTATRGAYRFYVVCDPEKRIIEFSEDNNLAIRSLLVKTSAEAKGPDLTPLEFDVSGVTTDPQTLRISGVAKVKFQNKGDDKIITPFRISVFEDKDNDGIYTEGADLLLGSWDYATPMNPNMAGAVSITLAGTVSFRDAPIYAMLDSGQVVFEQNKSNNSIRAGAACENKPANPVQPKLKWKWRSSKGICTSQVGNPPVIAPLVDTNGDGKIDEKDDPYIIFLTPSDTQQWCGGGAVGALHAVNGRTGQELFNKTDLNHSFYAGTYILVTDVNNDGIPEIIIPTGDRLLFFDNGGNFINDNYDKIMQWNSSHAIQFYVTFHGGVVPALADINGDGKPEIIAGPVVFNLDGSVKWSRGRYIDLGNGATNGQGSMNSVIQGAAIPVDLDLDGNMEIVAGNTAYNGDGTIRWVNSIVADGVTAVGKLGDDPYPTIVLVSSPGGGKVYVSALDHNGNIKWGPVYFSTLQLPDTDFPGWGSAPVIADFDGDGEPEIGVRGNKKLFILNKDGYLKMVLPVSTGDSAPVTATVFDLNGDGHPEILIHAEDYFRIFDAKTGTQLYQEKFGARANYYRAVMVADVDGDGGSEAIVFGGDGSWTWTPAQVGINVYGSADPDHKWVNSRKIWNEAAYHVTNVNDNGSIPKNEAPSWLLNNTYGCQANASPLNANPYLASDLSASFVRVDMANYPASVTITARIGNGGAKEVPAGVSTAFYNGDPANGGVLIGSALSTKTLTPGEYEDVALVWNSPSGGNHTVWVNTDAGNTQSECNKSNNSVSLPIYIASGKPDPSIVAADIVAPAAIPEGSLTDIFVTVRNIGTLQADNVLVRLYAGNPALGGKQIDSDRIIPAISAAGAVTLKITWNTLGSAGISYLYVLVDPAAAGADANRSNNTAMRQVSVNPAVKPDLQIAAEDIAVTPVSPLEGDTLTITATVHNRGSQTGGVKVALYDGIPAAGGIKRGETVIPQIIAQGGSAAAAFALDTIGLNGNHALYLRIDPDNSIDESDKSNNQASRSLAIAPAGLNLSIATNKSAYSANENILTAISATELNGRPRSLTYDLLILDAKGIQAASLPENPLPLAANAATNFTAAWDSGSLYAGSYSVMVRIKENTRIIAMATAPFTITPVKTVDARIVVDKAGYHANEQVTITATLTGNSLNYIFSDLSAKTSIFDDTGHILFSSTRTIPSLANGQRVELKTYWNTGTFAPGIYLAAIDVADATGAVITTSAKNIVISSDIAPSTLLKGKVSVDKQSLLSGETVNVTFSLSNPGNMDLPNVALSVLTVHVVNQNVYNTLTYQAALPMGAVYSASGQIDTTSLTAKDYLVILRANVAGVEETIAGTYFRVEGAPSAPAVSAPAHGADLETFTPLLSVSNVADPNDDKLSYEFEIYSDSGLAHLVASGTVPEMAGITAWTVPVTLTENHMYYWRARAYDGRLYGPWMSPATFRVNTVNDPPTAPTISSPAAGSAVATLTPVLTVNNAADPDSANLTYNFDLALDPDFTQIVASTKGVASGQRTTSWIVPVSLVENTLYYWRAQADDWLVEGPWSGAARFFVNTVNDAPTAPVVVAPVNGATVSALATDVVITNSSDPDSSSLLYYFEADTVPTFDSAGIIRSGSMAGGSGTTTWHLSGLLDNTRYYLRVKASDGSADGPWSAVAGFFANTMNEPPTIPVLANPSDGAGVNLFKPVLSVHNSTDLDRDVLSYEFELYGDAALTNLIAQSGPIAETVLVTGWTVPVSLVENQTCYWRARAGDGLLRSAWMPPASFMVNTANDAPGAPQLSAPGDGATLASLTPTLEVANASDPDSATLTYDFEVYNGNLLAASHSGVPEGISGRTSVTLTAALSDNTSYSWRARAFDGDRYGAWMNLASFKTHIAQTPITAQIEFDPQTLNKKSNGTWVNVKIGLPRGYKASDIDISSIRLEGRVAAELRPAAIQGDVLTVKFRRNDIIDLLPAGEQVPVHLTGKINSTAFEGMDIIRVIE